MSFNPCTFHRHVDSVPYITLLRNDIRYGPIYLLFCTVTAQTGAIQEKTGDFHHTDSS